MINSTIYGTNYANTPTAVGSGGTSIYVPPSGGNASLTTAYLDSSGNVQTQITPLWLQSIQTGSSLQFDEGQLQSGVSYIPIRRNEQYAMFSAVWSLAHFDSMEDFSFAIRQHYNATLTGSKIVPMVLNYYQNNLVFNGWVRTAQRGAIRFQSIYVRQYEMEMIMPQNQQSATISDEYSQFIPNASDQASYGPGWYQIANSTATKTANIPNTPGNTGGA